MSKKFKKVKKNKKHSVSGYNEAKVYKWIKKFGIHFYDFDSKQYLTASK